MVSSITLFLTQHTLTPTLIVTYLISITCLHYPLFCHDINDSSWRLQYNNMQLLSNCATITIFVASNCPPIFEADNVTVDSLDTSVNSVIRYTCITGHVFPDTSQHKDITCLHTMQWSSTVEHCKRRLCRTMTMTGSRAHQGVRCHVHFYLIPSSAISDCCSFVPTALHCLEPEPPPNTAPALLNDTLLGTLINLTCHTGYLFGDLQKYVTIECLSTGEWKGNFSSGCKRKYRHSQAP